MKIALAGQRSFGRAVLDALIDTHDVTAVFSPLGEHPRDPLYNGSQLYDIPWNPTMTPLLIPDGTDIIVAAHAHVFIGKRSRARTRFGGIGYHPSLLPRHRGRDAVKWTIHMKDAIAGGSIYWLTENVDCGPLAAQDWCHVLPTDTASDLWRRDLFPMGIDLILQVLNDLDNGIVQMIPQNKSVATWEPSFDSAPLHRPELPELKAAI